MIDLQAEVAAMFSDLVLSRMDLMSMRVSKSLPGGGGTAYDHEELRTRQRESKRKYAKAYRAANREADRARKRAYRARIKAAKVLTMSDSLESK